MTYIKYLDQHGNDKNDLISFIIEVLDKNRVFVEAGVVDQIQHEIEKHQENIVFREDNNEEK